MKAKLSKFLFTFAAIFSAVAGKPSIMGDIANFGVKSCPMMAASTRTLRANIPQIEQVFLELRTPCSRTQYHVDEANLLKESTDFNVNQKTTIFVSGWQSNMNSAYTEDMTKAYHCRGGHNFIVLNTSDFIKSMNYYKSAFNTEVLGQFLAYGLKKLNIPGKNIHLIGHSLGAHIMGSTGRHFEAETGDKIGRITGLDPARPCFIQRPVFSRLSKADATFVDIIHTNVRQAGTEEAIGHADFYPGGLKSKQPSCTKADIPCSHAMSIYYFIESVFQGNEFNFMGSQCGIFDDEANANAECNVTEVPMGYASDVNARGVYVLGVNPEAPYGRSASNYIDPEIQSCGECTMV